MNAYEKKVLKDLNVWQRKMMKRPSLMNTLSKNMQTRINTWIPESIHKTITLGIKQMIRAVLYSSKYTTDEPLLNVSLRFREAFVQKKIDRYRKTAALEGGITGAGGIFLGLADFPLLIGIKLQLLFEIAVLYGFDVKDYKERVYVLHIFELAFSSDIHRRKIYLKMLDWEQKTRNLPDDINEFDWRNFQQEYRDYLDLAKFAQLIPVIGAPVGLVVNYRLLRKLGITAMNAYRMRLIKP